MRNRRGANVVEFALTLPVFFGLVFGMVDFGWYFAGKATLDYAVNDGCRVGAMVDPIEGDPMALARVRMEQAVQIMPVCVNGCIFEAHLEGDVPARSLICGIQTDYQPFVGFWPAPDEMVSKTIMRMEWQR